MKHCMTSQSKALRIFSAFAVMALTMFAPAVFAGDILTGSDGTTGDTFKPLYDFFYGAATGYAGRAIAIVGGLIGLGYAAINGKAILGLLGVLVALFGVFGPLLADALFTSALI